MNGHNKVAMMCFTCEWYRYSDKNKLTCEGFRYSVKDNFTCKWIRYCDENKYPDMVVRIN